MKTSSPSLPSGTGSPRLRVDDLDDEVVLVDVQAVPVLALARDAGPDHLGKPVVVGGGQSHAVLDLDAGLVGPRLGAEEADAQVQIGEVEAGSRAVSAMNSAYDGVHTSTDVW